METLDRAGMEKLQLERLKATVEHCYNGSKFYKERFDSIGIKPSDIKTLDDLKKIPFTTKQDLRDTYPFGIASEPLDKCVRLHSSSGTTGNPTVILHSKKDLEQWANAVARCLWMVGCRPEDIFPVQVESILMPFKELGSDYLITLETLDDNDSMTVEVELSNDLAVDDYGTLQKLEKEITRRLKDEILITPKVKFVSKGSLPKSEGKAVRVKDLRVKF